MAGVHLCERAFRSQLTLPPDRFFSFDYPKSTFTSFNGINAQGFICGRYLDASGIEHGIQLASAARPGAQKTGSLIVRFGCLRDDDAIARFDVLGRIVGVAGLRHIGNAKGKCAM